LGVAKLEDQREISANLGASGPKAPLEEQRNNMLMNEVIVKRFETPDEIRTFGKGKFEIVKLKNMTIGRATYEPGWKWSTHVGASSGKTHCDVEHVGIVISGCATAAMKDGEVIELRTGDAFYIPPDHDSWVIGDEPYVSLHLMGAGDYAKH
jgi:quercetin dioxygenase-like cupin family protein